MGGTLRVALLGTGLIGGSIGLALGAQPGVEVVAAYDAVPGRADEAVAAGACRRSAVSVADAVADADVVFVAVPVSSVADLVIEAAAHASRGTVVTDVGSVKAPVVEAVSGTLPEGVEFVGGHPMAGSEQAGIEAATPELFRNAVWVVTPTPDTDPDAVLLVHRLVSSMGASALTVDPTVHDESVSVISHLPHIAASALMNTAADRAEKAPPVFRMAAGGFRDVTRIAAGSPDVWVDILEENRDAIRDALHAYVAELERFCEDLADRGRLRDHLARAGTARSALPSLAFPEDLWAVVVAVTDHPGVFADVTTAVGASGVNIVDVTLRHSPEGGAGLLTLGVAGRAAAETAVRVLQERGYAVHTEPTDEETS